MSYYFPLNEKIETLYEVYCKKYEKILDRRFKLLVLVPGYTMASFALPLLSQSIGLAPLRNLIFPLGFMGTFFVLGLFAFLYINLVEANLVGQQIQHIEQMWHMPQVLIACTIAKRHFNHFRLWHVKACLLKLLRDV